MKSHHLSGFIYYTSIVNLQAAVDNESTKIEVDEIPAMMTNSNNR